ncbi:MAG: hypothetical protein R3279_10230 [Putridiphycobacter sp.]|nr:hypothetical protein [Putridiphycobacter sp.]
MAHVEISIPEESSEQFDTVNFNYAKADFEGFDKAIHDFYSTEIISNYLYQSTTGNGGKISFDISSVDSLGSYLDPLFGTYFEFKMTANKLIIMGPDGKSNPEDDIAGMTNMLSINATIAFEKEISELITVNDYVKKIDDQTIEIKTSVGGMNYNDVGNKIEIFFK